MHVIKWAAPNHEPGPSMGVDLIASTAIYRACCRTSDDRTLIVQ
jgi:hypothetical protein